MAGTDFSHLTNDELIKGIQALNLPDYIRSKAYGIDVRETIAQMTEMVIQLGVNMGLSPDDALEWARKLEVTDERIDNLIATAGDGTTPSELTDIRVGQDGQTYSTAGEAVRTQFTKVNEAVGHAINTLPSSRKDGHYLNLSGVEVAHENSYVTDFIPVASGMTAIFENMYLEGARSMVAFDENKNYVEYIATNSTSTEVEVKIKENWAYIRTTGATPRGDIVAYYTDITGNLLDTASSLKNANKTLSNFEGTRLLIDTDLNNLTFGAYHTNTNNVTKTLLNAPKGISGALKVIYMPFESTKGIMQVTDAYSKVYTRQFTGTNWTGWIKSNNGISYPLNKAVIDRTELAPDITSFTPTLASWNATDLRWELEENGKIETTINVTANKTYLIDIGYVKGTNQMGDFNNGTLFDVKLGDASISIYALNDANWRVALTPTVTGSVPLILGDTAWHGYVYTVSVTSLTDMTIPNFSFNDADVRAYDTSIGIGMNTQRRLVNDTSSLNNGKRNTAFGMRTHENLDTGYDNTAVGYQSQMYMTNGLGNTAVGNKAQRNVTTGVYNTTVGWNSQANLTTGNWNTALGLEAQMMLTTGVNNVSIGRRSSDIMTTGNHNVHIGAHSGFYPKSTIDSEGQVFVGQQATQLTDGRQDRAIAIGQFAHADADAIAIGSGVDAQASEIVIGKDIHTSVKIAGKTINFNADGTVTWTE